MTDIVSTIPNSRLLPAIHGLRGLAATSVVVFHLHHLTNLALPDPLSFVGSYFDLGVQLFFVLSAFSLCYSTMPSISKPGWTLHYFIKRLFRIAPLFYVMLGAWLAVFYVIGHEIPSALEIFLNLLFAYNFVPGKQDSIVAAGWTIGVEMAFYVVFPVLIISIARLRQAFIFFVIMVLVSQISRGALIKTDGHLEQYAHHAIITSLGVFAVGILAYWTYWSLGKLIDNRGGQVQASRIHWALVLLALTLFVALISDIRDTLYMAWRADIMVWSVLFGAVIVWQALFPSRPLASLCMEFLGERSYSIYLLHPMVIFWLTPINQRLYADISSSVGPWAFLPCAAITLGVVIGCSTVTHRCIEVPGINLGRMLISRTRTG